MRGVELFHSAFITLRDGLGLKAGEQFAVVTDTMQPLSVAEALCAAARTIGAEPVLMVVSPRIGARSEVPSAVAEGIQHVDALVMYSAPSLYRSKAIRTARERGVRMLTLSLSDPKTPQTVLPDLIETYFVRGISDELAEIRELSDKIGQIVENGKTAHLTAPAGTDLWLELGNKVTVNNGLALQPGQSAGLPPGVFAVAAPPKGAKGVVVVDVSIPPLGRLMSSIRLEIEDRVVTRIEGGEDAERLRKYLESFNDQSVYNCPAEWGFGTHSRAIVSGNFLEEERILGYAHVALGDDTRFDGGAIKSPVHLDGVIRDASLEVDGQLVIDQGRFLV